MWRLLSWWTKVNYLLYGMNWVFDLIVFYKHPQKKFTKIERIDVNHKKVKITLDLISSKLTHWSKPFIFVRCIWTSEVDKKYADWNVKW
jgi:hypothetical protein